MLIDNTTPGSGEALIDLNVIEEPGNPNPPTTEPADPGLIGQSAKELGGDRFDGNGNLIKDSKIVKTATEIADERKEGTPEPPTESEEGEEEPLTLNEDGNLVNTKGEVVHKKGDFTVNDDGTVELKEAPYVDALTDWARSEGRRLLDENGNPLKFEDSTAGHRALTAAIARELAEEEYGNLLQVHPDVAALAEHVQAGFDPHKFYETRTSVMDYSKLAPSDDVTLQKQYLRDKLVKINQMTEEDAAYFIKNIEDNNDLRAKSELALNDLKAWQQDGQAREQKQRKEAIEAETTRRNQMVGEIKKAVNVGRLDNIEIPTTERAAFADFLTTPTKEGGTQSSQEYDALPLEKKLLLEYLVFKKLDLSKLIAIKAQEQQADLIKNRGQRSKPIVITNPSNGGSKRSGEVPNQLT